LSLSRHIGGKPNGAGAGIDAHDEVIAVEQDVDHVDAAVFAKRYRLGLDVGDPFLQVRRRGGELSRRAERPLHPR
jgi:hypothetical protein